MSNSDDNWHHNSHRLTITVPEPDLEVLVIDADGSIVDRGESDRGPLAIDLPRGLYTVRSCRSGNFAEAVVRLGEDRTVKAPIPAVFSAAAIPGAATTHEYYTYPAWQASQTMTSPDQKWNGAVHSGLMLFARAPHHKAYRGNDQFSGLSLRATDGRTLSDFSTDTMRDDDTGWSAFSARASAGLLILDDRGKFPRQIPVPMMHGWQTQLYVMHSDRLLWEDVRFTMVAEHTLRSRSSRSPYDAKSGDVREAQEIDAGLLALQNDSLSVAPKLIRSFLSSKFRNPILGLLGAYLMLLRFRCTRVRTKENDRLRTNPDIPLIREVLSNLDRLMPHSPDVVALHHLAKDWVAQRKLRPIKGVPLFRCGAEVLLEAAASDPSLVPEGSLLDVVSGHLHADTVWTTWKPIELPIDVRDTKRVDIGRAAGVDWVELSLVDEIKAVGRRLQGVASESPGNHDIRIEDIVRRIGVSHHAIRSAMNSLLSRAYSPLQSPQLEVRDQRLLSSDISRSLAKKLGAGVGVEFGALAAVDRLDDPLEQRPNIQKVYATIKKSLAEVAVTHKSGISADTALSAIMQPAHEYQRLFVNRRLSQSFPDLKVGLSDVEFGMAETVRDIAKAVVRKWD